MIGMMSYCSMILRGDVFPTLSPCEAVGVEQEVTEADVSIVLSDMASYKAPETEIILTPFAQQLNCYSLNPQQPFEFPILPAMSLCYAVSATLHTSDSIRIEQFPYFAPNLSASPIADALC
ncbi:hypothetical protein NC652_041217 [Populus alba x Populus x berolinensis]|nr:hypothetical protein NC652_041217 [Populus alba x Populus x berolinensis]